MLHSAGPDEGQTQPLLHVGVRGAGGGAGDVWVTQRGQGAREAGGGDREEHTGYVVTTGEQGEAMCGHSGPEGHPPGHLLPS